jgi:hypothetical protein
MATLQPAANPGGWAVRSSTIGETYSYTFWGTGFDLTGHGSSGVASGTISIDGSLYTGAASVTNTATWTPGTSTFTLASAACDGRIRVTGLSLGLHKVTLTVAAVQSLNIPNIDIITPIHSTKSTLYADLQNTLPVGSCSLMDSRKTSLIKETLPSQKAWAQAVGVTSGPTTTSTSAVPLTDLSTTVKTSGGMLDISYSVTQMHSTGGQVNFFVVFVNGLQQGVHRSMTAPGTNYPLTVSDRIIVPVSAGVHKVDVYWWTSAATATAQTTQRSLLVQEF